MVNRVADKESAKSILKHNGNQAAMIGMEILYTIISALTVTTMMAAFSAAAVSIYGTTLVSLVVSIINDLNRNRDAQGTVRSCTVSLLFVSA